MIQVKNSTIHYINERALTFSENDLNDPQRVAVSLVSGTVVMAYVAGTIDYAANGNYERWTLKGYSTKLINNSAHYVYARLSRADRTALVVFSVKDYNIDGSITTIVGKDENGEDITESTEPSSDYFFIKIGELTATDGNSYRELTYDSGLLSTDKGNSITDPNDMWELDKVSTPWLIRAKYWLQSFTVKGFITLIGGLVFKNKDGVEKPVVDIKRTVDNDVDVPIDDNTIPTTAYVKNLSDDRYLKKYEPDETEHRIKFFDGIEAGRFVKGMVGGSGTQFDGDGYGEMNGLTLREFLEVPELRFNRIDVVSGELWNSIAFGLVESVDTGRQICYLKLEDRERSGLQVYDICRGIFADFGEGTQWEGEDECGFRHLYGFWTSYFTPTEIIENKEGSFAFRYQLKPGTTQHPAQSMKFAVYGNFVDKTRQASAYSTRTYKRYLNNVDTWVIDPDKHIYAQYGELEGLVIGGMEMHGYGSFQSNSYFTGVQIQFTPQQKEELKGEDAYSVVLSTYEGVVVIDDEGKVIGGENELMNVVSDGGNVVESGQNVITSTYRLSTQINAMRGSTQLHYSPITMEGSYVVSLKPVGCTAMFLNGTVVVTSVTDTEECHVDMTVNCEGNASFQLTYVITAIRDGKNPIVADIDNEMDSVACDSEGNVIFGLPVGCKVNMWAGTRHLVLERMEIEAPQGVFVSSSIVDQDGNPYSSDSGKKDVVEYTTGVITIPEKVYTEGEEMPGILKEAARSLPVNITVYASHGGMQYHKELVFTVNKVVAGENARLYRLVPSVGSVSVEDDGSMTASSVSCLVNAVDGKKVETLESLPKGLSMYFFVDDGVPETYAYGSTVSLNSANRTVTFQLYSEGTMIDIETIPIVQDGGSPVVIDLDNEMQSVACDEDGKVLLGLPLSTGVKMYHGTRELFITGLEVSAPEGVSASSSGTTVTVSSISDSAPENLRVGITGSAYHGDVKYTRTSYLVINKLKQGENAMVVDLLPSVTAIKVNKEGGYVPTSISCRVRKTTGKSGVTEPAALPDKYTMKYALDGDLTPDSYSFGSILSVTSVKTSVTFYLYYDNVMVDRETIPVVSDAVDAFKSTVFIRSNEEPETPTGGSYGSPVPTSTPKWSDGIPEGEETLWASTRIFTSDGSAPHQSAWTEPRRMTDTASFEAIYSEQEEEPDAPDVWPDTPGEWTPPSPWTDDPSVNSVWMATATKHNGQWSKWVVSKIKGEDGKPGVSTLTLQVSSGTVTRNSFGTYNPSKILVRSLRGDTAEKAYMSLYGVDGEGNMTFLKQMHASEWEVDVKAYSVADYSMMVFKAYGEPVSDPSVAGLSEVSVNFTGTGSSGPMPRNRGEYDSNVFYAYNEKYRDFVWTSDGQVYMRDGLGNAYDKNTSAEINGELQEGCITGITPSAASPYWLQASRESLMAIDTALIDGAYIGGFVIQDKKMTSQNDGEPTLTIDGINGSISAKKGDIGGFLIENSVLVGSEEIGYIDNPEVSGSQDVILSPAGLALESRGGTGNYSEINIGEYDAYGIRVSTLNRTGVYVSTTTTGIKVAYAILTDGSVYVDGDLTVTGKINASGFEGGGGVVDTELDEESDNAIANSAVTKALNAKIQVATSESDALNGTSGVLYVITE